MLELVDGGESKVVVALDLDLDLDFLVSGSGGEDGSGSSLISESVSSGGRLRTSSGIAVGQGLMGTFC